MKTAARNSIFILMILAAACVISFSAYSAEQRSIPPLPEVTDFKVEFNGDSLKGYYLLLDFRTRDEKERDLKTKSLAGDVILFTHGHAQRADDSYALTSKLAAWSKSGIVIIPICDTPFGLQKEWRGDRGKTVILMEIARHALAGSGIAVKNYRPLTDIKVTINKKETNVPAPDAIQAKLSLIGWSHGSILARSLANAYPDSADSLVQMAPAGFVDWGSEYITGTACLMSNFAFESSCIGLGIFRGEGAEIFDSGWGLTKGLTGDAFRSCPSCISGNFSCLKPFRNLKDAKDCTLLADDRNLPVPGLKNITVLYGSDDSLFQYDDHAGIKDPEKVTPEEKNLFFERFYPSAVRSGAKCTLKVLPGNHIGPVVNSGKFAEAALSGIGE